MRAFSEVESQRTVNADAYCVLIHNSAKYLHNSNAYHVLIRHQGLLNGMDFKGV